jgi:hypothetical protein
VAFHLRIHPAPPGSRLAGPGQPRCHVHRREARLDHAMPRRGALFFFANPIGNARKRGNCAPAGLEGPLAGPPRVRHSMWVGPRPEPGRQRDARI